MFPNNNQITIIDILLKHTTDANLANASLLASRLFFAALYRKSDYEHYKQILKTFLTHKVDINAQDNKGSTLLMDAIKASNVVELLLKNGAKSEIKDNREFTALDYATRELENYPKSVELTKSISLLRSNLINK